jgi:hypothetical protein
MTHIGICYPLNPGPAAASLDPRVLDALRKETGASLLRVDCDHRNPSVDKLCQQAADAGFAVLPILCGDYALLKETVPDGPNSELATLLVWASEFVRRHNFPMIEVLNEPHTMHGMSPEAYATIVNAVGQELHAVTTIAIACEALRADKRGPEPIDYFLQVLPGLQPDLWHLAAQHPYRNPGRPSIVWRGFDDRSDELEYVKHCTAGKGVITTEVGWEIGQGRVGEYLQSYYINRELEIQAALGIEICVLYNHIQPAAGAPDFGLLRSDLSPRPAAHAVRAYLGGS